MRGTRVGFTRSSPSFAPPRPLVVPTVFLQNGLYLAIVQLSQTVSRVPILLSAENQRLVG